MSFDSLLINTCTVKGATEKCLKDAEVFMPGRKGADTPGYF